MAAATGAMTGLIVKFALMAAIALAGMYAARVAGNYIVRNNREWPQQKKDAARMATTLAATIIVALFVISIAGQ